MRTLGLALLILAAGVAGGGCRYQARPTPPPTSGPGAGPAGTVAPAGPAAPTPPPSAGGGSACGAGGKACGK